MSAAPPRAGARTLVLGLDGATWDVLLPLQDELPHLRALWERGVGVPLQSTIPAMTLPSWSSALTGCHPGTHGILDFTRRVPGTYRLAFASARDRRVPTIHRILSDRGQRVASLCVPTTYPPESLDGVVVSGFDSPVATAVEALHCQPRALHEELVRRFGGLRFADFQEGALGPAWYAHAREAMLREVARKEALCAWLLARERWDLFWVVFGESDTASHHFWRFHDPHSPRHPRVPGPFDDTVRAVYRRLDAAVGRLAAHGDHVCVVSDHGFGGAGTQAVYLNRFLEAQGWLRFRGGDDPGGGDLAHRARALRARGLDRLRTAAMRLPVEKLLRRLPPAWTARAETAARWGDIDFAHTRAWSDELNYAATVHLNVRGRDPLGTVADRDTALHDLTALLLGWEIDGKPVVARVHTREEARVDDPSAPDLLLDLALEDGYSRTLLPSARVPAGTVSRRLAPHEYDGGKGLGMNGSHRDHGVLILAGANVERMGYVPRFIGAANAPVRGPAMPDVAPTLLALAGETVPAHMEGRVLAEFVRSESWGGVGAEPPPRNAPPPPAARAAARETPAGATDDEALRRRLEALGYL